MGAKTGDTDMLRFQYLRESVVLLAQGSAVAGCDLSASSHCTIPSHAKGIVDTRLAVSLTSGTYAQIAPQLRLAARALLMSGLDRRSRVSG